MQGQPKRLPPPALSKRLNQLPIDKTRKQEEQEIVTSGKMENKDGRGRRP